MSQQDAIPCDSQLIPATQIPRLGYGKQKKSRIPVVVQAQVLALKSQGATNSEISRTCDIDRGTVIRLLSSADIQQHVSEIRSDMVLNGDLVKSVRVMRRKLNKGSESAATTILRGFNVLQSNPKVEINIGNLGAQTYAQRMQARQAEQESPCLEVKALESTTTNGVAAETHSTLTDPKR